GRGGGDPRHDHRAAGAFALGRAGGMADQGRGRAEMKARIRKIGVWIEETHEEAGRPVQPPSRKAVAAAVIENPFAGRYVEDLSDLMDIGEELGAILGE